MSEEKKSLSQRSKPLAIAAGIGLLLGAVGTGYGMYSLSLAPQSAELDNTKMMLKDEQAFKQQLQQSLARVQGEKMVVKAQLALMQASIEVERQNFGTASQALQQAVTTVQGLDTATMGLTAPVVQQATATLNKVQLAAGGDTTSQRAQLEKAQQDLAQLLKK